MRPPCLLVGFMSLVVFVAKSFAVAFDSFFPFFCIFVEFDLLDVRYARCSCRLPGRVLGF